MEHTTTSSQTISVIKNKIIYVGLFIKKIFQKLCGNAIQLITLLMVYPTRNTLNKKYEFLLEMVESLYFNDKPDPYFKSRMDYQVKKIRDLIKHKYTSIGINDHDFKCAIHLIYPENPSTLEIIDMAIPFQKYIYGKHDHLDIDHVDPGCKFNWDKALFRIEFACVYRWYGDLSLWVLSIRMKQIHTFVITMFIDLLKKQGISYEWIMERDQYITTLIDKLVVKYNLQPKDVFNAISPVWNLYSETLMDDTIKFMVTYHKRYVDSLLLSSQVVTDPESVSITLSNAVDTNENMENDLKRLKTT